MAKENFALLVGPVTASFTFHEVERRVQWTQRVMRRNGQVDEIPVIGYDRVMEKMRGHVTDPDLWLVTKGFVSTRKVRKSVKCPHCETIVSKNGTKTELMALDVARILTKEALNSFEEMSNQVIVLGNVMANLPTEGLSEGTPSVRYRIATNRKVRVEAQPQIFSDYPEVLSLSHQAFQDAKRLERGSQCLINGGLQARDQTIPVTCPSCNNTFGMRDVDVVIVPNDVEYLMHCRFDEKEKERAGVMR